MATGIKPRHKDLFELAGAQITAAAAATNKNINDIAEYITSNGRGAPANTQRVIDNAFGGRDARREILRLAENRTNMAQRFLSPDPDIQPA